MTTTPTPTSDEAAQDTHAGQEEMCCDGKQTAAEHRHNSPDGKCCIDK